MSLIAAVVLASSFLSPNGELDVVIDDAKPRHGALWQILPSGNRELLAEFDIGPERPQKVLVADDGYFVTLPPLRCGSRSDVLTIRRPDGSIVRTLRGGDLFTWNDRHCVCRARESVRFSIHHDRVRMTLIDDSLTRSSDIDLATGEAPAPDENFFPEAIRVTAEEDDGLLARAITRVDPEYPEVAMKARIAGRVGVEVTVGRDGRVTEARVIKPLPFGLDEAAKAAVSLWTFEPAETGYSGSFVFRFEILRDFVIDTPTIHCSWR